MKKICSSIVILCTIFLLGCASNSASAAEQEKKAAPSYKSEKNNSRFDDWKYKGFGMPLPEWVEAAIDGKTDKVAKALEKTADKLEVLTASGINVDHSEEQLKSQIPEGKELIEGFWVRINTELKKTDEPYITVLVYEK